MGESAFRPIREKTKARRHDKSLNIRKNFVRPLDTLAGVRMEMARCYREAREGGKGGKLSTEDMTRYINALDRIRGVIEAETAPNAAGRELRITLRSSTTEQLIIPSRLPSTVIEHEMQHVIDAIEESVDQTSDNPKD